MLTKWFLWLKLSDLNHSMDIKKHQVSAYRLQDIHESYKCNKSMLLFYTFSVFSGYWKVWVTQQGSRTWRHVTFQTQLRIVVTQEVIFDDKCSESEQVVKFLLSVHLLLFGGKDPNIGGCASSLSLVFHRVSCFVLPPGAKAQIQLPTAGNWLQCY